MAEMRRLIDRNPRNQDVIFPYVSGREVNTSPTHAHHRYVIDFGERSEDECRLLWPDLMAIVEQRVKPERAAKDAKMYPRMVYEWWKFWNARPELRAAAAGLDRVLAIAQVSKTMAFAFLSARQVYSHMLVVFRYETYAPFCGLQARPHEIWTSSFASSLEDRLLYAPSDCFETFPFPRDWETAPALEAAGHAYYEFRASLMICNDEGLTKTYNRFHDPYEDDPKIQKLRELHAAMDRAVLDAYGWTDIPTDCDFLLDYEIDEETWGRKKKPYRYRWPDDIRDEVLARLLELNARRAAEEARSGKAATAARRKAERPSAWTSARRASATRAAEPRPLRGTSDA